MRKVPHLRKHMHRKHLPLKCFFLILYQICWKMIGKILLRKARFYFPIKIFKKTGQTFGNLLTAGDLLDSIEVWHLRNFTWLSFSSRSPVCCLRESLPSANPVSACHGGPATRGAYPEAQEVRPQHYTGSVVLQPRGNLKIKHSK